jgi:hypothetical protein
MEKWWYEKKGAHDDHNFRPAGFLLPMIPTSTHLFLFLRFLLIIYSDLINSDSGLG